MRGPSCPFPLHTRGPRSLLVLCAKPSPARKPTPASKKIFAVAEKPASTWGRNLLGLGKQGPASSNGKPSTKGGRAPTAAAEADEEELTPRWGFFDLAAYNRSDFVVPWGPWTTFLGIFLWFGTFVSVGFFAMPAAYRAAGIDIFALDAAGRAQYTLVSQFAELAATAVILFALTRPPAVEDGEDEAEVDDAESVSAPLFSFDPRGPFSAPNGWLAWGLLGVAASPFVVGSVATLLSQVGYDTAVSGTRGTVDGVVQMLQVDTPTYLNLLATTALLAPVMEEAVFRGFLLTSLTKFMPVWAAILASSTAFGLAHLSPRDLPVLIALGCLLGASYVRSRNLLTPILIHGAWNGAVLSALFALAASGVDVQKMLTELK